jgi:two-component system, OmpR family, phosphate regulon sensor histidine kinase PhoR
MLSYRGTVPQSATEVLHDLDLIFAVGEAFHDRRPTTYETYAPHPDRLLRCQMMPIFTQSGDTCLVIMSIEDVTRLRHLETVRRDFVANVSHELRTPITSINLIIETLQAGAMNDPEVAGRFLQRMEVETLSMMRLVEELLELSKLESGRIVLNLSHTNLQGVMRQVVRRLEPAAREKEIDLAFEAQQSMPQVVADADRLEQVLLNLTHNAIKFTAQGGQVTLRASRQGRGVLVEVIDTGVGMDAAETERIFERFYKVDPGRSRETGTGLGLAIARHLVDLHGSKLQVVSERGRGSRFSFFLSVAS